MEARQHPGSLLGVLALCAVTALAGSPPHPAEASGGAQASIVGGRAASIAEFPSLAYIQADLGKQSFACTGTVVAPRVVLTAAHCVESLETGRFTPAGKYLVATGVANIREATAANVSQVVATHVFPNFNPGLARGDAALMILASPSGAPPLALANAGDAALYSGGTEVTVAGWGLKRGRDRAAPTNLRAASMTVQPARTCRRRTRAFYPGFSPAAQLCLLNAPAERSGACFGDSGGPAIGRRPDGTPVELGITSIVGPFCTPKAPTVLTRTDLVSSWVAEWIAATESGAPAPVVDPRARLPLLTRRGAEEFALYTLVDVFGRRFQAASEVSGRCQRASRTRFRCQIAWIRGRVIYVGTVSPFYVRRQQTVTWDSHFRVEWAVLKCIRDPGRRCAIHSRRG